MADYINKNEVLNLIMHNDKVCHYADERYENVVYATACRISDVVANMPATDVQPVIHSRWIPTGDGTYNAYCENCGQERGSKSWNKKDFKYCFGCGARMDGDTE